MARNRTATDFIEKNEEQVKLERGRVTGRTFREKPQRQGAGGEGHDRPLLDHWTTPELRTHALRLNIDGAGDLPREALMDAILAHQGPQARASRRRNP